MREIILDTETTGLSPADGHRVIEIGALEVINRMPTGRTYHQYINPEREIEATATRVHGITNAKVSSMPVFADIIEAFLEFVADSPIVAHNARFDMNFLNHELRLADRPELANEVVDTLTIARQAFPGAQVSLDALCRRYEIDLSGRTYHGALLDANLLAMVYLELTGGQQPGLLLDAEDDSRVSYKPTQPQPARSFPASATEVAAHQAFVGGIEDNLWGISPAEEG